MEWGQFVYKDGDGALVARQTISVSVREKIGVRIWRRAKGVAMSPSSLLFLPPVHKLPFSGLRGSQNPRTSLAATFASFAVAVRDKY